MIEHETFLCTQLDLSMVELFFLRMLVNERIENLKKALESPITNMQANEMLDIYDPLYRKIDKEIERRSLSK